MLKFEVNCILASQGNSPVQYEWAYYLPDLFVLCVLLKVSAKPPVQPGTIIIVLIRGYGLLLHAGRENIRCGITESLHSSNYSHAALKLSLHTSRKPAGELEKPVSSKTVLSLRYIALMPRKFRVLGSTFLQGECETATACFSPVKSPLTFGPTPTANLSFLLGSTGYVAIRPFSDCLFHLSYTCSLRIVPSCPSFGRPLSVLPVLRRHPRR